MKSFNPTIILSWLERSRIGPYWWIAILCALLVLPALFIRAAHYEEGTTIALARAIFEDGLWPGTYRYGYRFAERPQAVSWLLAVPGYLIGGMPVWLARIPTVVSLLAGASLIFWLVRRYASVSAGLFAAASFLAAPMMLAKLTTAEPDIVLSVMMFAALVLFWRGYETGGPSVARWIAITAVLAPTGLVKGPQPLGYFFLGVGAFLLLRRQWKGLTHLIGTGLAVSAVSAAWYVVVYQTGDVATWSAHSRIVLQALGVWLAQAGRFSGHVIAELLPGILMVVPLAWSVIRRGMPKEEDLIVLLILYATLCTLILVAWPGAKGRYSMPAVLAVAACAGLAYDRWRVPRPWLVGGTVAVGGLLICYQLIVNWIVMPAKPDWFRLNARLGQQIASTAPPGTLLVSYLAGNLNPLAHIPQRVRVVPYDVIARAPPVWFIVTPSELAELRTSFPAREFVAHVTGERNRWQLVEVRGK